MKFRPVNHKLQIFFSILTLGLWLPIYFGIHYLSKKFPISESDLAVKAERKNQQRELRKIARQSALASQPHSEAKNLGYKKSKRGQMYVLACSHQIRASKTVGLLSQGMIGREVFCEVCNAQRLVTGMPYWVQ